MNWIIGLSALVLLVILAVFIYWDADKEEIPTSIGIIKYLLSPSKQDT